MVSVHALVFLVSLAALSNAGAIGFNSVWGYLPSTVQPYGPDNWYKVFAYASGKQQSPINIVTSSAVSTSTLDDLEIEWEQEDAEVINNGATVDVEIENPTSNPLRDAYGVKYYLNGVHFHWHQTNNSLGSEHTIDGQAYVLEAHFVHFKSTFASLGAAVTHNTTGDVSVIGVLFKLGTANTGLAGLVTVMGELAAEQLNTSKLVELPDFNPKNILPSDMSQWYHYKGGLTTPGCAEVVHWYVVKEIQTISAAQLAVFRSMKHNSANNITHNFRPVQALNGRTVYLKAEEDGSGAWTVTPTAAVFLASVQVLLSLVF